MKTIKRMHKIWSAPTESRRPLAGWRRRFFAAQACGSAKAVSPLRSATALQIRASAIRNGLLAVFLTTGTAHAADYTTYTGFAVDDTPVLPAAETHPSLWFTADQRDEVRARKDADAFSASTWEKIAASPFLTMDFPPVPSADDDKKPIHQYYGSMSQIAAYCGFMAQVSEDAAGRQPFLDRTIGSLERAYDGPVFELDPKISSSPVDEIYRGVWMQSYAAAYDWVQPFLTAEQDARIRQRLIREGREVADKLHQWVDRPHNHLSKPAWGLGSLALALSHHPDAKRWLAVAIEAANENTRYFFSADGIYREGSHYLVFSWINFIPFTYHYRNVSGVDQFPAWQPLMEWGIAARNGKGWLPNIEDSFIRPFPAHMVAGAYRDTATRLHASASLANLLQWTAETTDLAPFIASEKEHGFNYTGASWDYPLPLYDYLTCTPGIEAVAPDTSPTVFLDNGQSFFRNTWAPGDPAQRYLLFQGVAEADNHEHYEHLSFILFAENQMMASDAGYTRKSYGEPMRKQWYRTAAAHNVVTLAGSAPVDAAENRTPISRYRIDTSFFDFEEKEAPYPNGGLLKRAVAFPGESYFVIADTLSSPEPAEAVLHLHGGRGTMTGDGSYRVWTYDNDVYGPAAKLHAWIFGTDADLADHEGELTYIKGDFASFPYVTATSAGGSAAFLQILIPADADAPKPTVHVLRVKEAIAARVHGDGAVDHLVLQRASRPVTVGEIETDATFCWVRQASGRIQAGVREATYLRHGSRDLLKSESPVTRAFEAACR